MSVLFVYVSIVSVTVPSPPKKTGMIVTYFHLHLLYILMTRLLFLLPCIKRKRWINDWSFSFLLHLPSACMVCWVLLSYLCVLKDTHKPLSISESRIFSGLWLYHSFSRWISHFDNFQWVILATCSCLRYINWA